EYLARGIAPRDALGICRKNGKVSIPSHGQVAPLHRVDLVCKLGVRGPVRREELRPLGARRSAARTDAGGEMLADAVGDEKLRILRPPVAALDEPHFIVAERLAVGRGRVLLVRRAVADVGVEEYQPGATLRFGEHGESV